MRAIQQPRADAVEDEIAWDLEEAVAEEEQPGADAVLRVAQPEVALERARGEPDVHAIDVGDDVADEDERDDAPRDAVDDEPAAGGGMVRHRGPLLAEPRQVRGNVSLATQPGRDLDLDAHSRVRQAGQIIMAAGRTSPKYLRSVGQHSENSRGVGQDVRHPHDVPQTRSRLGQRGLRCSAGTARSARPDRRDGHRGVVEAGRARHEHPVAVDDGARVANLLSNVEPELINRRSWFYVTLSRRLTPRGRVVRPAATTTHRIHQRADRLDGDGDLVARRPA